MSMLDYDRINVSEGTNTNKTDGLRGYIICHYWCFLGKNFRFQPKVHDGCRYMTQKSMSFNNFAIVSIRINDYIIIFGS